MAILLSSKTNVTAPSAGLPFGQIKDNPGDGTGTPVDKRTYADFHQFFAKMFMLSEITANGLEESHANGFQYIEALMTLIRGNMRFTLRSTGGSLINLAGVTFGNNIYVSVGSAGATGIVFTSPDGFTWTVRTPASNDGWSAVTFGNGTFVAVAASGQVMSSTDGINWTLRTAASAQTWRSVIYSTRLSLFVAVASSGTAAQRIMTSPDGITWTARTAPNTNDLRCVAENEVGILVAVASTGVGNRVTTSADGITWTARTSAADNTWVDVKYAPGLFVAVAITGSGNRIMTSPDGITWTSRTNPVDNDWRVVQYGSGIWVSFAGTGTGNRIMTSKDGINWTIGISPADYDYKGITYSRGLFIVVGAQTSSASSGAIIASSF